MAELIVAGLAKIGVTGTIATAAAQIGASILLSTVARRLGRRSAPDQARQLSIATSTPAKRFVYGIDMLAIGSPAPAGITKDGILYTCHIINSRASAAVSRLVIDKRDIELTGDRYDFAGAGAAPSAGPLAGHANFWIGRGAQSGPPAQIMTEVGDVTAENDLRFWPTDKWTGQTVIWSRLRKGAPASQSERWPSAPPEIGAVGDWSLLWDPRDNAQDPDDASTWTVSNNAWLAVLDCLRNNPLARWELDQINLPSFIAAANDADATRARLVGDPEPRWRVGGTLAFGGGVALLDMLLPLVAATGGDLMIDGGGITAIPALAQSPVLTITDPLRDSPMTFRPRAEGRDLPRAIQALWPQPEAKYEMQTLTPAVVPGQTYTGGEDRVEELPLDLVPFAGQAMHLQQIAARKRGITSELSFTAGPELLAEGATAGDWVTVDFGADFPTRNGVYQITETSPGEWMGDTLSGAAFRQAVRLRGIASSVYAFVAATDEQPVYVPTVPEFDLSLTAPTLALFNTTQSFAPAIRAEVTAGAGNQVAGAVYGFQFRLDGDDEWQTLSPIQPFFAEEPGQQTRIEGFVPNVLPLSDYEVRVRAEAGGRASAWVVQTISTPEFVLIINAGEGP